MNLRPPQKKPKKRALWLQLPRYRRVDRKPEVRRIKRRTSKRAKEEARYRRRVRVWLTEPGNGLCFICIVLARSGLFEKEKIPKSTQCHHKYGRIGPLLLDERFWIPASDFGHQWIDRNRALARQLGLLAPIGQWNTMPKD